MIILEIFLQQKKISDSLVLNSSAITNKTVDNYIIALVNSFLIYKVNRYDIKGKDFLRTQEKYYVPDIGLRYNLLGQTAGKDAGHVLENIIYLELLRKNYKVFIGKVDEYEVDFVAINEAGPMYIQVALTTREDSVLKRELRSLQKINDAYPKILLTLDDDLETNYDGIKKINALKWLLEQND